VRLCLLTAQRSRKVSAMRWADLSGDEWTVPQEPRQKSTGGALLLPKVALDIIRGRPRIGDNPHVFAGRGNDPFCGFGVSKQRFNAHLPPSTPRWTVHDARRTARSLMSRAGVSSDHAERVMGHVIGGVEGVYDRHSYRAEKADALARLAALIDAIVHPRANVMPLVKRAKRR
jgi:integrase